MTTNLTQTLMDDFADSTGVTGKAPPRRYLWTDAFAVCNFLELYGETNSEHYLNCALQLVDQVHHILGRHRSDDPRSGWISGLSDEQGNRHPTRGGLRIGKELNERRPDQPPDSRLEWDQDGQYFHYLTKWMHALCRVTQETGQDRFLTWAAELAAVAHKSFTYETSPGRPKRMVWKMSIDLSRPLVDSMGQHDPLDGLITYLEVQTSERPSALGTTDLAPAIADTTEMCGQVRWVTEDPLGIGGLLDDAIRLTQIVFGRGIRRRELLIQLLLETELSLQYFSRSSPLGYSAEQRLAFRELGLSIGLHGLESITGLISRDRELANLVQRLLDYRSFAQQIDDFWTVAEHRNSRTWVDHHEINSVMLATSLAPAGYVKL
jgi:hypothetical protein